jgi:dihydroorotate dehydrogenase electron transfer subunit
LGCGFKVPPQARRLLLVADVVRMPVLLPLARQNQGFSKQPGFSTAILLSAPTAAALYPIRLLPPALEVHVVTADGSAGYEGSALDLFPDLVRWTDCVCAACDPAIYSALAEIVRDVRLGPVRKGRAKYFPFAQALVVPPLGCGVGACQGCAVSVAGGFKLACTDGPVFDLLELR